MSGGFLKTGSRLLVASSSVLLTTCYHPPHKRTPDWDVSKGEERPDRLTAQQALAKAIPQSPDSFSPDPSQNPPLEPPLPELEIKAETTITEGALLPPTQFNPDPGMGLEAGKKKAGSGSGALAGKAREPLSERFFKDDPGLHDDRFFRRDAGAPKEFPRFVPDIPNDLRLPRERLEQRQIEVELAQGADPGDRYEPEIGGPMVLPRKGVRYEEHISENWHAGHYEHADAPSNSVAIEDRYRVATGVWNRYLEDSVAETPYERATPYVWHPYYQSVLKGDIPVIGQDIFVSLTAQHSMEIEGHEVPIPSGVSSAQPNSSEFYGRGDQFIINTNTSLTFDLFKGETSFKPVEWLFRIQPVFNTNFVSGYEANVVSPDPRGLDQGTANPPDNSGIGSPGDLGGFLDPLLHPARADLRNSDATDRFENQVGLQQFFFESHLLDLSENYDFAALRVGTQTFNADFRGHVFMDSNWGYRLFGNYDKNRIQYNVALFDLFEKESFSDLNTFEDRNQNVFVANVYFQDFLTEGYTAEFSFLANWDNGSDGGLVYDSAGNIVRPTPLGTVSPHDLQAYYLGWNGEGHIGRMNVSHSLYHVFGQDEMNGLAGRSVDIDAWMAALELSVDTDWMRHKFVLFCASGDDDATDNKATGWDSIIDNPNFIGPFSYWQRQGMNLGGTAVSLKQRLSLIPELSSNKFLGQSNFVNPGIFIAGLGEEWELTPRMRAFANLNYLMFMDTNSIATALLTDNISREIGWDLSFGVEYRPFLTDNLKLNVGMGMLFPGAGFKDIYSNSTVGVPGYSLSKSQGINDVFYSGFLSATMTF
ncbi:MAG: hypothetical protein WCH40_00200 [Verrucomicrobiales bacterium]